MNVFAFGLVDVRAMVSIGHEAFKHQEFKTMGLTEIFFVREFIVLTMTTAAMDV